MHFTSGKVSSQFLQQQKNSLLFLADTEMIHHKSSPFLFQDHLMHSSVTWLWPLLFLKSSSFPATYLAVRRVCWNMTRPNKRGSSVLKSCTLQQIRLLCWNLETPYLGLNTILSRVFSNRYSREDQVQGVKSPAQQSEAECFSGSMQEFPKK